MTAEMTDRLAVGRWHGVPARCSASFAVRNFGVHDVTGTIPVRVAWVDVDASGPAVVYAELDVDGIATGNARRDADLQTPHLLDADAHPVLTFAGSAVPRGPDAWQLTGVLAGKAEAEVVLDAGIANTSAAGELTVHAVGQFDRRALGIRAARLLIGRRVAVILDVAFRRPS